MRKWLVPFIVLIIAGVTGALYIQDNSAHGKQPLPLPVQNSSVPILERKAPRTALPGQKEYRSEFNWFQLSYPDALVVSEIQEKGSARTILFYDPFNNENQFQIFILPYGSPTISTDRFAADGEGAIESSQQAISIDGIQALTFVSENAQFGELREVWFINHGFLYEVSVPRDLENWLSGILATWQFL